MCQMFNSNLNKSGLNEMFDMINERTHALRTCLEFYWKFLLILFTPIGKIFLKYQFMTLGICSFLGSMLSKNKITILLLFLLVYFYCTSAKCTYIYMTKNNLIVNVIFLLIYKTVNFFAYYYKIITQVEVPDVWEFNVMSNTYLYQK